MSAQAWELELIYERTQCQSCGCDNAIVVPEPRYHGFRGRCPDCGGDWPES
ncbi:MAG: hypothetical protein KGI27_07990 [Thaumarchaeota archaeon]|nr:hypothetical protein [Nitrososphaerota archaeon]